jgi:prophage DNA circulation protein
MDYVVQASFGGVDFECLTTRDSVDRDIVEHTYPRVDGADLQDMGAGARRTDCRVIFRDRALTEEGSLQLVRSPRERFLLFRAACHRGGAQDFVHPVTGTYSAMCKAESWDVEGGRDYIEIDVTFIEDGTAPALIDPGPGDLFAAGLAALRVQAALLEQQLRLAGLSTALAADALANAESWDDDALSIREINLQLLSFAASIDEAVIDLELATNVQRMPILRGVHKLQWSMRQAAASRQQSQQQIVTLTIARNLPLRVILADFYGAAEVSRYYDEVVRLNDIADVSLILAGTTIRVPARSSSARRRAS